MKKDEDAWKALDKLYQYGFEILRSQNNNYRVEGIFISDSGVLFVRQNNINNTSVSECLKTLLTKIKIINERMRVHDLMITTSVAYGSFKYQERIEFPGINKNPIYGDAYLSAFLDNEKGKPKIQPGQCRIVKENLPFGIDIENNNDEILKMVREKDGKHYYFYWMVNNPWEIDIFEQQYRDAYNLKYKGFLEALKGNLSR